MTDQTERFRSNLTGSVVEIDAHERIEPDGHTGVRFHYVKVAPRDARAGVRIDSVVWFAGHTFAEAFTSCD